MTNQKKRGALNIKSALKTAPVAKKPEKKTDGKKMPSVVVPESKVEKVTKEVKVNSKGAKISSDGIENKGSKKDAEYLLFIEWCGTPLYERTPKTQKDLATQLGVTEATLSDWKKRKGFYDKVAKHTRQWGRFRTSDLIGALYTQIASSRKPAGRDLMVWLQYVEKFNPKLLLEDETPLDRKYDPEQRKAMAQALLNAGLANQKQAEAFAVDDTNEDDDSD